MTNAEHGSWIKLLISAAIAAGTAVWGWFGWLVIIWVCCMSLDFLTGTIAAVKDHDWSSSVFREGLLGKAGMIVAVIVSMLFDVLVGVVLKSTGIKLPWTYTVLVSPLVLCWYCFGELGSTLENAHKLGAPLPGWLKKVLRIAKQSVDTAGSEIAGDSKKEK